jgi:hypothetical protein
VGLVVIKVLKRSGSGVEKVSVKEFRVWRDRDWELKSRLNADTAFRVIGIWI